MGKRQLVALLLSYFHVFKQCQARVFLLGLFQPSLTQKAPRQTACVSMFSFCRFPIHFQYKILPQSCQASLLYKGIPRQCFHILGTGPLEVRWKPPVFVFYQQCDFCSSFIVVVLYFCFGEMLGMLLCCTLGSVTWMESGYAFQLRALHKKGFQVLALTSTLNLARKALAGQSGARSAITLFSQKTSCEQ